MSFLYITAKYLLLSYKNHNFLHFLNTFAHNNVASKCRRWNIYTWSLIYFYLGVFRLLSKERELFLIWHFVWSYNCNTVGGKSENQWFLVLGCPEETHLGRVVPYHYKKELSIQSKSSLQFKSYLYISGVFFWFAINQSSLWVEYSWPSSLFCLLLARFLVEKVVFGVSRDFYNAQNNKQRKKG